MKRSLVISTRIRFDGICRVPVRRVVSTWPNTSPGINNWAATVSNRKVPRRMKPSIRSNGRGPIIRFV